MAEPRQRFGACRRHTAQRPPSEQATCPACHCHPTPHADPLHCLATPGFKLDSNLAYRPPACEFPKGRHRPALMSSPDFKLFCDRKILEDFPEKAARWPTAHTACLPICPQPRSAQNLICWEGLFATLQASCSWTGCCILQQPGMWSVTLLSLDGDGGPQTTQPMLPPLPLPHGVDIGQGPLTDLQGLPKTRNSQQHSLPVTEF